MSHESARRWETFAEAMKSLSEVPAWPVIECTEDLIWATRVVSQWFRRSAASLRTKDNKEFDAFSKHKYGAPVWFRGEAMRELGRPLCPFVFRPEFYLKDMAGNRSTEKWMITEFWRKAVLRGVDCPAPNDRLAWLALAQHHGLPTRLLDWTESILVAAWFAVCSDELANAKGDLAEKSADIAALRYAVESMLREQSSSVYEQLERDCAKRLRECSAPKKTETVMWALSPAVMNWRLNDDGPFFILKGEDAVVQDAFSGGATSEGQVFAIWQQSIHARMVQQNAYFTIHGSGESLEDINLRGPQGPCFLVKLVIPPQARESIRKDLAALGVNKSVVYPGLDSLSVDVSERWREIVKSVHAGESV